MAKTGTVIRVNPNRITGTVQDPTTGRNYDFLDAELPSKGISSGNTVNFEVIIIANIEIATGLQLVNQPTPA